MSETKSFSRNPELMSAGDTALLVVDVQEKLIPLVGGHERIVWNVRRLIDGAGLLGLPVMASEQYPQGLGSTVPELAERIDRIESKVTFSCGGCPALFDDLEERGIHRLLVVGIETHVCVAQTVFDLMAAGFGIYVAVDATGARYSIDYETALRRMESSGATLTTTEAALFEWCQTADTPAFKAISAMIKEPPVGNVS